MRDFLFLESINDNYFLKALSFLRRDFIGELPQALKGVELFLNR